jgi:hypothetical protein
VRGYAQAVPPYKNPPGAPGAAARIDVTCIRRGFTAHVPGGDSNLSCYLEELGTAGPVFWIFVVLFVLFVIGTTMEKLRKRKLEIDMQKKLDRGLGKNKVA